MAKGYDAAKEPAKPGKTPDGEAKRFKARALVFFPGNQTQCGHENERDEKRQEFERELQAAILKIAGDGAGHGP